MKSALQFKSNSTYKAKFLISALVIFAFSLSSFALQGATVLSTSVFSLPTSENTHIIIETNQAVSYSMIILKNPHRVVLDLKNTPIGPPLISLAKKDFLEDVSIKQVRVGSFKLGITRIVFDLKSEVKALLNMDKPKDKFKHRLTLYLYPIQNKQMTINQPNSTLYTDAKDLRDSDSKSTGAKIILEPNYEDDELLMDEY